LCNERFELINLLARGKDSVDFRANANNHSFNAPRTLPSVHQSAHLSANSGRGIGGALGLVSPWRQGSRGHAIVIKMKKGVNGGFNGRRYPYFERFDADVSDSYHQHTDLIMAGVLKS
jgi:hypothetical protein